MIAPPKQRSLNNFDIGTPIFSQTVPLWDVRKDQTEKEMKRPGGVVECTQ